MTMTNEDLKLIRKFDEIRQKGYYCNGGEVTAVYNRVLNKSVPSTNCGSCIRQRIQELVNAANQFEKMMEKENKAISSPSESKTSDELMKEKMARVRAARKPKNDAIEDAQQAK